MAESTYRTAPDPNETGWPKGVPYIVGNEGCERFSYYGMRSILQVHLTLLFATSILMQSMGENASHDEARAEAKKVLDAEYVKTLPEDEQKRLTKLKDDSERHAQEVAHLFVAGVYALPMIGAIIADRLLGKYITIMVLSLVYCAGHAVLAVAENSLPGIYLGLGLIAVGSGGIKPCVSAHVGDQFGKGNWHLMSKVFQIFYFSINFGSFFATLLIPWLNDTYGTSVAFGIPGILMFLATIAFWMGRKVFIHVQAMPAGKLGLLDSISSTLLFMAFIGLPMFFTTILDPIEFWITLVSSAVLGFVLFAARQRIKPDDGFLAIFLHCLLSCFNGRNSEAQLTAPDDEPDGSLRRNWFFASASEKFGTDIANGPYAVLRIISVFLLVSIFWALFDQHMSSWIRQAQRMDLVVSMFGNTITLLPSQIQSLNPLMVMLLIPFTNYVMYPGFERMGFKMTPLRKMTIGMGTASLAFVAVALIQHKIDAGDAAGALNSVSVLWQIIPYLIMTTAEVMVSITGLEFAYTQAPKRMKSTIMGFWLLAVALGNKLVAVMSRLENLDLANFFWVFAGLMLAAALLFGFFAAFYKYQDFTQDD